jgi:hypothetical protein
MTNRNLLLLAASVVSLAGCKPAATNDVAANDVTETAAPANEAAATGADIVPADCTATKGVSSGPYCGFEAQQNLFPPVRQPSLTVHGDYRLGMRTGRAYLKIAQSPSINPTLFLADLKTDASGNGGNWYPVSQAFEAKGRLKTVIVTDDNGSKIEIPVTIVE